MSTQKNTIKTQKYVDKQSKMFYNVFINNILIYFIHKREIQIMNNKLKLIEKILKLSPEKQELVSMIIFEMENEKLMKNTKKSEKVKQRGE